MEEDNLEMGMFDNLQLNTSFNIDSFDDENTETLEVEETDVDPTEENDENINAVENEGSEEVDSEEDDPDEGGDEGSTSSSNLYSSLATVVHEQGLLPSLDITKEKIETIEDLVKAFEREQQIQAEAKFNDYIANVDINKIASSRKELFDLDSITEETLKADLNQAKEIIYRDLINQNIPEAKAAKMVKRLIDLGEDAVLEDAAESLLSLKEFENRKIESEKIAYKERLEQEKIDQENLDKSIRESVYESKNLINGLNTTKALQDKVYKNITEIVGKSPEGYFENRFMKDRRENPIEFEARMHYIYELTDGFKNYSKLKTSAKTDAVKDLENLARKATTKDNGTPLWMQDGESYGGSNLSLNI